MTTYGAAHGLQGPGISFPVSDPQIPVRFGLLHIHWMQLPEKQSSAFPEQDNASYPVSWTMVRSGRGRTLAPNDINPLIHLLSPIKHVKLFQECYSYASIKNKLTGKSSQSVCSSLSPLCLPRTEDNNRILCHQLFVLVLSFPFHMIITFI